MCIFKSFNAYTYNNLSTVALLCHITEYYENGTNSLAVKAAFTFPSPSPREQLPAVLQRKGIFVRNKNFKVL